MTPFMSERSRARQRHRFYKQLFVVTVVLLSFQALPPPAFRVHLLGSAVLNLLLLIELGCVIPREAFVNVAVDPLAVRNARFYRMVGALGLVAQLIWVFTPASASFTGLPVMVLIGAFVFWSLQRLIGLLGRESNISREVIAGAVAGYLLLGLCGGLLFAVLETLQPGSFQNLVHLHHGYHDKALLVPSSELNKLIWDLDFSRIGYFAFVALTTTGFGDIVPVTPVAEVSTIALSIAGSLYLALVMGLLISRFTVQTQQEEELEPFLEESPTQEER